MSSELAHDRHAVFATNFPRATRVSGDVREIWPQVITEARRRLAGRELDLLYATPPCQGMSKNGRGKLLSAVRRGERPAMDERNRLILPTLKAAAALRPRVLLMENVPEMLDTLVADDDGRVWPIVDLVADRLDEYVGRAETLEFADYGVPQRRQRAITIFTRDPRLSTALRDCGTFLPTPTHGRPGTGRRPWVTLRDAIGHFPPLDAAARATARHGDPFHRVPLLDEMKHWWVSNTPEGAGAFDNQCDACGFAENPTHRAGRDGSGINRASDRTPVYCARCEELLPRPSVADEDNDRRRRIMRGYTSAYRRMRYDEPASTLTRNLSYACSDRKLHPTQHRVLSLAEAFRVHTLDRYDFKWRRPDGRRPSDKTIREIIGESIPPAGFETVVRHLAAVMDGGAMPSDGNELFGPLFAQTLSG